MRRLLIVLVALAAIGAVMFWLLTWPVRPNVADLPVGDPVAGETVFWAGGCTSCHSADGAKGDDKLLLGGNFRLASDFGTFIAPNISPDPDDGIGAWTSEEFAAAMMGGVSPDGRHYYPSFPYTSYARMTKQDISDLWAYMKTLPPVEGKSAPHELSFPFTLRRGIGLWKLAFFNPRPVMPVSDDEQIARGQYLVEGPGHCGECHTPRGIAGQLQLKNWLAGGPSPEGDGRIPAIHSGALDGWSAEDVAYYLESGFTPDFDSVGGSMVSVQENMSKLPAEDREAIAAYLKSVPAP